jgi:ABC-type transport system involved in cytochrome c biogenesis ATPase subunit
MAHIKQFNLIDCNDNRRSDSFLAAAAPIKVATQYAALTAAFKAPMGKLSNGKRKKLAFAKLGLFQLMGK